MVSTHTSLAINQWFENYDEIEKLRNEERCDLKVIKYLLFSPHRFDSRFLHSPSQPEQELFDACLLYLFCKLGRKPKLGKLRRLRGEYYTKILYKYDLIVNKACF